MIPRKGDTVAIVNIRFPADLHARLVEKANDDERSVAAVVRLAVREYLATNGDAT